MTPAILRILPNSWPNNFVLLRRKALNCVSAIPQPAIVDLPIRD